MKTPIECDILILGAGFAGAATAFHLAREKKLRVVILEREAQAGLHASGKNAGLLRQAVTSLQTARHIQETRKILLDPPQEFSEPISFQVCGSLLLGSFAQLAPLLHTLKEVGVAADLSSKANLPKLPSSLLPFLQNPQYQSLLASPGDGVVDCIALLQAYLRAARSCGAQLEFNSTPFRLLRTSTGWCVETARQIFLTRLLVNATGAFAKQSVADIQCQVPELTSYRRHLIVTQAPIEMKLDWPFVWKLGEEFYFRSEAKQFLMCPGDEEKFSDVRSVDDPQILTQLKLRAAEFSPDWAELPVHRSWSCLRSKTPDGLSYIDWDAQDPHLFWVCGLGGHGMSASYGIGQSAAAKIKGFFDAKHQVAPTKCVTG